MKRQNMDGLQFSENPENYHRFRPEPPGDIYSAILQLAKHKADLVVDLGCGTGISTLPWANLAVQVCGIDPSEDMLRVAMHESADPRITYRLGSGSKTGLDNQSVNIVACSSSIHWMNPVYAIEEIHRILKPDGVFAAFGPQVPIIPLKSWKVATAFNELLSVSSQAENSQADYFKPDRWKWADILNHVKKCDKFRFTDELCFNVILQWNANQYYNWARSFSFVNKLISSENLEVIDAFETFKAITEENLGDKPNEVLLCYRMIVGIV